MAGSISAFNNAGIVINAPFEECSDEDWQRLSILTCTPFLLLPGIPQSDARTGKGSIINTASMSGIISNTPQPQSAYNSPRLV